MFGLADSVMIEKYTEVDALMENLRVRFENQNIYTYIRNGAPPPTAAPGPAG